MKTRITTHTGRRGLHLIACFGRAQLFERADGRAELRDASPLEETEAKEWISLFRHHTVLHLATSARSRADSRIARGAAFTPLDAPVARPRLEFAGPARRLSVEAT